jgi:hypothetical protein
MDFDAYRILSVGTTLALTTSSSRGALPTTAEVTDATAGSSARPRFVRVLPEAACYIKFGDSTVAATLNDILVTPNMPEVFAVRGCTHVAGLTRSGTANLNVTPIDG